MTHFEMLYGVYGVKVARKFVVLSVWVRVPIITQVTFCAWKYEKSFVYLYSFIEILNILNI
jgi:hypothetical protein